MKLIQTGSHTTEPNWNLCPNDRFAGLGGHIVARNRHSDASI